MWEFNKKETNELQGPNEQFENFTKDGSIIREVVQNSIDALREDEECLKIVIDISERSTSTFPGGEDLRDRLKLCTETFDHDTKAKRIFAKLDAKLSGDSHWLVSFKDENTKGLEGGLALDERGTNLYQLIYGIGTTNKGNATGTGGSFGVGKMAPFARAGLRTIIYDTKNSETSHIIGKTIIADSYEDEIHYASTGYNMDSVQFSDYLGKSAQSELGTSVHIPFYVFLKEGNIDNEVESFLIDVLSNFIISVYYNRLEVIINVNDTTKLSISKSTLFENINILEQLEVKSAKKREIIEEIKVVYNLLSSSASNEHRVDFDENNYAIVKLLTGKDLSNYKKVYYTREQLMKIKSDNTGVKSFSSYAALVICNGSKINDILRQAEPTTHDKWVIKNIDGASNKDYYREFMGAVHNFIRSELESKISDSLTLETNKSDNLEREIKLVKLTDKTKNKLKKGKGKLNNTNKKVKNKDKSNIKPTDIKSDENDVIVWDLASINRIRKSGKSLIIYCDEGISSNTEIQLSALADNGGLEKVQFGKPRFGKPKGEKYTMITIDVDDPNIIPDIKLLERGNNENN